MIPSRRRTAAAAPRRVLLRSRGTQWKGVISNPCTCMAIGNDYVAVALDNQREGEVVINLWTMNTLQNTDQILLKPNPEFELIGHDMEVKCMEFYTTASGRDQLLCSVSQNNIFIWRFERDSSEISKYTIAEDMSVETQAVSFDSSGSLIALAQEKSVEVIQVSSAAVFVRLEGHISRVTQCKFHPISSHILVTTSEDRTFKTWDLSEKAILFQSSVLSMSPIISMNVSPIDGRLYLGFSDGMLRVYSTEEENNYCRELVVLDLSKYLKKRMQDATAAEESGLNETANLPDWAKSMNLGTNDVVKAKRQDTFADASITSSAANAEDSSEVACPVLQIGFMILDDNDDTLQHTVVPTRGGYTTNNGTTNMFRESEWIIVGTSGHLVLINSLSNEMRVIQDLQQPVSEATHETTGREAIVNEPSLKLGPMVQLAKSIGFRTTGSGLTCGLLSAFSPALTLCFLEEGVAGTTSDESVPESEETALAKDIITLSVFPSAPPPQDSVLLKTINFEAVAASRKSSLDKPVTFHSKIRSSGYGSPAPPKPLFGIKKKKPLKKQRPSSNVIQQRVSAQYPVDCDLQCHYQSRNDLPPNALNSGPLNSITYSPDGRHIAIAANDKSAFALQTPFSKYRGEGSIFVGHDAPVSLVRWSYQKPLVLTTSRDNTARVWKLGTDDPVLTLARRSKGGARTSGILTDASFFYLDKFIALASSNAIRLYQYNIKKAASNTAVKTGGGSSSAQSKVVCKWEYPNAKQVTSMSCHNSFLSHLLVSAGSDKSIMIFDAAVGKVSRLMKNVHTRAAHTIALPTSSCYVSHPPSSYDILLSSATDSTIHLWDLRTNHLGMQFRQHVSRVHSVGVAFSPCMRYIASGSEDKACYIYDIRTGKVLERLHHSDVVSSVAYHPVHPQVATASFDGRVRFYSSDNEQVY